MDKKVETIEEKDPVLRHKMYKSGKNWLIAAIFGITVGTTVATTAHADTSGTDTQSANANTQAVVAGGNAVTITSSSQAQNSLATSNGSQLSNTGTNNVVADSSSLIDTINQAKNNGLNVTQKPTDTITVPANEAETARQQVESDYAKQQAAAQNKIDQYNQAKANEAKINQAPHADTSGLDQAVNEAKNTPGITVVKDNDKILPSVDPTSDQSVADFMNAAKKENDEQEKAVKDAIATQKQNNQDYENQLKKVIDSYSPDKAIRTDHIYVDGKLATIASDGSNKQVDVSVSNAELSNDPINEYVPFQSDKARTKYAYNLSKDSVIKVKVHNAATDSSGRQLDVTYTFSDFVLYDYNASFISDRTDGHNVWMAFGKGWPGVLVNTGTNNIAGYNVNESFTYTDGTPYTGKILISFASLDMAADNSGAEAIMPKSGVLGAFVNPKSHIGTTPVAIKGPATALTPKVYMCETPNVTNGIVGDYTDASIVFLANGNSNYTYVKWGGLTSHDGGFEPNGKPLAKNTNNGYAYEHTAYGTGNLGVDPIIRKTTEIHYHYVGTTTKQTLPGDYSVDYQLHNIVTPGTPTPTKSETNADGQDISGQTTVPGEKTNYTLNVQYHQYKDIQASNSNIQKGFVVIDDLPESAETTNSTDWELVTSDGQQAVQGMASGVFNSVSEAPQVVQQYIRENNITPNGAFIAWWSVDPQKFYDAYVKTGTDLQIKVPSTVLDKLGINYENHFWQGEFGGVERSNDVPNHTPKTPKSSKAETDESGKNIDGATVTQGQNINYSIQADYTGYKGINVNKDDINKGFYIIDDVQDNALTYNTNNFTAHDQNGNPVDMIYARYDSLEQAPEKIKEQVLKSGIKLNGAFVVAMAKDPESYFEKYVKTGEKVTVEMPMKVKDGFTGELDNTGYQFEFGHGTPTNTTHNKVVPRKTPTPQQPTPTPQQPLITETPNPVMTVSVSKQQVAPQKILPQTGNNNDESLAILGLAALGVVGTMTMGMSRKRYGL